MTFKCRDCNRLFVLQEIILDEGGFVSHVANTSREAKNPPVGMCPACACTPVVEAVEMPKIIEEMSI